MKTNKKIAAVAASLTFLASGQARAHIGYGGRDFGIYSGGDSHQTKPSITISNISSDFGWAAATDANFGDSHRMRAFRFNLASAGTIALTVVGGVGFLPGVSLYSGLGHLTPEQGSHDSAILSQQYLAGLPGPTKVGSVNALGDWAIGNDPTYITPLDPLSGILYEASIKYFDYIGHVADGTAANYGNAAGINGDGATDGYVSGTFALPAGDYSFFVGGANLASESPGPTWNRFGATVSVSVIPEPSGSMLVLLSAMSLVLRRRRDGA